MKSGIDKKQESSTPIPNKKWWHAYLYFFTFPVIAYAHSLIPGNLGNRYATGGLPNTLVYHVNINKTSPGSKFVLPPFSYNDQS